MIPRLFDPEADADAPPPCSELTVSRLIADYLAAKADQVRAGIIKPGAEYRASLYCLAFARDFGRLPVASCRRGDIKRFLTLHPNYRSPSTKHDAAGAVVSAFRWAVDDGLIASNPYARPRDLPAPQPRTAMKPDEVRTILTRARTKGRRKTRLRFRFLLWFLWEVGCRTCEGYDLDWEHYDPSRGLFELDGKTTAKTGRKRLIVLSRRASRLTGWLWRRAGHPKSGSVFENGRGRAWNRGTFGKLFRKHADAAGVRKEVSAYCARHGFCCRALEAGHGERQIADYMGHTSTRYVAWYGRGVRSQVDYLREVAEGRKR